MENISKINLNRTHYLPVGRPSWELDINNTGKFLLAAIGIFCLGIMGLIISSVTLHGDAHLSLANLSRLLNRLSKTFLILSVIPGLLTLCGYIGGESPTLGGARYSYYKCNLDMDEKGMTIQLADDWDFDEFQYSWSCPWEKMDSVRITQDTAIDGYIMIAKGNATVWYIHANHSVDPVPPLRQRKIFGGKNTIIVHLGVDVADIQSVLETVKKY